MTDLKAAARAGSTQAIAQLMNQSFQPKGIGVKVAKSGSVLKILMESKQLPDRKLAGAVRKGLDGIKPQGVEKVFLKAQSSGGEDSWTEQWALSSPQPVEAEESESAPVVAATETNHSGKVKTRRTVREKLLLASLGLLAIFGWGSYIATDGWQEVEAQSSQQEQAQASDPFAEGIEFATNAANLAQTATSENEWQRTSNLWNAAANKMKAVPEDSPNKATADQKATEYEKNRQYAADRVAVLEAQQQQARAWYEGGTLHNASALDWQKASYENKLATCADFIAAAQKDDLLTPNIAYKASTLEGFRALSEELVLGMDAAMKENPDPVLNEQIYTNQTVSDIAVLILIAAKWAK